MMNSLLLTFLCALVNSQARTLTAADYHRPSTPAPSIYGRVAEECRDGREKPPAHLVASGGVMLPLGNFGKDSEVAPPAPHHAPPTHEVSGGGASPSALKDYGKEGSKVAPPSPHHAPPTHEVRGGGAAGIANYGKEGRGKLPPPSPHHAPPTHEVSGGGAAELERSMPYELLSASA